MSVFVDDMYAPFRNMCMCHMIADTHDELIAMAERIGVQLKWIQHPNTPREHFDIAQSKRRLAVSYGAIEMTWRQLAAMTKRLEVEGKLGDPEESEEWMKGYYKGRGILP